MSEANKKPETIFDDPALALKAKRQEGMEGEPTLRPGFYENNPRLIVKTKVPNDKNFGTIDAKMSNRAFFALLRAIEELAKSDKPGVFFMDNKGHRFIEKRRDPNPSIMSCTKVEKNAEGIISICISAGKNRPLIEFPFIDCDYHNFRDANGPMPPSTASRYYALGWVEAMRGYMELVIERNYQRPAWMDRNRDGGGGSWQGGNNNNRGGGGGGNWGNQQSSNSSQAPSGSDFSFDADIPL